MTTQREVADAFFAFENTPSRASNMKIVTRDGSNSDAYLIGAGVYILAEREGLDDVTVWRGMPSYERGATLSTGWVRRQQRRKVRPALRDSVLDTDESFSDSFTRPPIVTDRSDIDLP